MTEQSKPLDREEALKLAAFAEAKGRYTLNSSVAAFQSGALYAFSLLAADTKPIDMVLYCPKCGVQHIDAPDLNHDPHYEGALIWTNPPHKSHLCHGCGHIWRPSDTPTNGVASCASGKDADTKPVLAADKDQEPVAWRYRTRQGKALPWFDFKPELDAANRKDIEENGGSIEYAYTQPAEDVQRDAEVTQLVREIHQAIKRGKRTEDHGLIGNLKCILDHALSDAAMSKENKT